MGGARRVRHRVRLMSSARSSAPRARRPHPRRDEITALVCSLFDAVADAVVLVDDRGLIAAVNCAAERLWGWEEHELAGRELELLLPPAHRDGHRARALAYARSDEPARAMSPGTEFRGQTKDGRIFRCQVSIARVPGEEGPMLAAVVRDTSAWAAQKDESERAVQVLEEARGTLAALFDGAEDGIVVLDAERRARTWNRGAADLLPPLAVGAPIPSSPESALAVLVEAALGRATAVTDELRVETARGASRLLEATASPIRVASGEVSGVLLVARDVTRRRADELEAQAARRLESLGRFAGSVAHDFNNFLSVILSCTSLLSRSVAGDDDAQHEVTEIERAAGRAASLTGQLLTFARQQVIAPQLVPLDGLVERVRPMAARVVPPGTSVVLDLGARGARVHVDPSQFEALVLNLVAHRRERIPDGGRVVISTSRVRDPAGIGWSRVSIADDGPALPELLRTRVFEPTFSPSDEGPATDLALASCHGIVAQAGGQIRVRSEGTAGVTFIVDLPDLGSGAHALAGAPQPAGGGPALVLVVEDDRALRSALLRILAAHGYVVLDAADAAAGVAALRARGQDIALVLTDVVMPGGGGRAVAGAAATHAPSAPVLFMSGFVDVEASGLELADGRVELLTKPFAPAQLIARIRTLLEHRSARPAVAGSG